MLNLQLDKIVIQVIPRGGTLGVEQNAVPGTHDGHLGQVIGIVVALHYLAQRRATVAEHVNL